MDLAQSYAEQHRKYLQSEHPSLLREYEKSGDLEKYLQGVGEDAASREEHLATQSLKETRDLPFPDQMRALANRREEAKEMIRHDLIYQPAPKSEDDDKSKSE